MLNLNNLKTGTNIIYQDEPYTIISTHHTKLARGSVVQQTKLKNLINDNLIGKNFKSGDKLEEAKLTKTRVQFLYQKENQFYFLNLDNFEELILNQTQIGAKACFLKEETEIYILNFGNKPINIELPPKIVLKVVKAPPGIKGNTTQGGTKQVTLETGARITTPLFIKKGDEAKVNTETGEYVERV